ncbi:MAG: hypothetical protein AAB483_03845 [Patescibacteria group bacterium]
MGLPVSNGVIKSLPNLGFRPDEIDERVQRGAALLDKRVPGWVMRINLETLDIGESQFCVLGQLFKSYSNGFQALGIPGGAGIHGFNSIGGKSAEYALLNPAWKCLIKRRRQPPIAA